MRKKNNTYQTKKEDVKRDWMQIDASGKILGKVATEIADLLIGKHKPTYTPHVNVGDKVVVTNAEKIAVTGRKLDQKTYYRHTGYPGGIRSETLSQLLERRPDEVVRKAVKGMLPKNKLLKQRMKNLYIYAGAEHPHAANVKTSEGNK